MIVVALKWFVGVSINQYIINTMNVILFATTIGSRLTRALLVYVFCWRERERERERERDRKNRG